MESTSSLIPYLFAITFALAIGFAVWQWFKATKAKREGHRSADAMVHGDRHHEGKPRR
jgi:hypothetical protein